MSKTILPPIHDNGSADDDDTTNSTNPSLGAPNVPGTSDNLLEELRRKTEILAKKVGGEEDQKNRVLQLDSDKSKLAKDKIAQSNVGTAAANNPAVAMIRDKLSRIYKQEPDAAEEALEAYEAGNERTKHQQYMYDLSTSGKSLVDIQTEWHKYYLELPEHEKHEVWKEFYAGQRMQKPQNQPRPSTESLTPKPPMSSRSSRSQSRQISPLNTNSNDNRTSGQIKNQLLHHINAGGKLNATHHLKSLLFGVGLSGLVLLIITFVFFNEVYVAPFIRPNQSVSATPIIGNQTTEIGQEPKIIIPKINLEVPVVFDLGSIRESDVQNALEDGVVHYASTPKPGEVGNSVIVGHSSNNILNSGKYKFAFVLLKKLEAQDVFFVHRDGVRYTYKVYKKEIVPPTDVSVLRTQEKPNTITLITCDPPGTSINRLIITAEQISPDPASNALSTAPADLEAASTEPLPSNAPSLWSRIWPF